MNKICGYSCEHNKGGVCQITMCDKQPTFSTTTENYMQVIDGTGMYYEWYVKHLQQELQRKDNIINELKEYLKLEIAEWQDVDNIPTRARVEEDKDILDKIEELENENK